MAALPKPAVDQTRLNLAWDFNIALRDGLDEVISNGISRPARDTATNVLYQTGVGEKTVEDAFDKAVRAAAAGEPAEEIGKRFAEYVRVASAHYVEITACCVEDPDWGRWVTFEPGKEVAA